MNRYTIDLVLLLEEGSTWTRPIRYLYGLFSLMLSWLYASVVVRPLAVLYFHGPQLHGFGFWAGMDPEDICSRMTGAPSSTWVLNMDQCQELLMRDFYSHLLLVQFLLAVLFFYGALRYCWLRLREPIETRQYLRIMERQHQLEIEKFSRLLCVKDSRGKFLVPE